MEGRPQVMAATNAFGLGFDRAGICFVLRRYLDTHEGARVAAVAECATAGAA